MNGGVRLPRSKSLGEEARSGHAHRRDAVVPVVTAGSGHVVEIPNVARNDQRIAFVLIVLVERRFPAGRHLEGRDAVVPIAAAEGVSSSSARPTDAVEVEDVELSCMGASFEIRVLEELDLGSGERKAWGQFS